MKVFHSVSDSMTELSFLATFFILISVFLNTFIAFLLFSSFTKVGFSMPSHDIQIVFRN